MRAALSCYRRYNRPLSTCRPARSKDRHRTQARRSCSPCCRCSSSGSKAAYREAGEADAVHSTQRRSADYIGIDEPGRRTDKRTDRVQQLRLETCNLRLQRASACPKTHSLALFRSQSDYF